MNEPAPSRALPEVLIVEDDPDDRMLLRMALSTLGLESRARWAEDGEALFEELDRGGPPALVLLDLNLPRVDGRAALAHLRSDERYAELPVVVLSTSAEAGDVRAARALGVSGYVQKPASYQELVQELDALAQRFLGAMRSSEPAARRELRVLLVDDDEDMAFLVRADLGAASERTFAVDWVPGALEALHALRGQRYDFLLLDQRLGASSGLELLSTLRASLHLPPALLLTGGPEASLERRAREEGALGVFDKSALIQGVLEGAILAALQASESSPDS